MSHHRVVVIGAGPAGYTAAIYAARALLQPVLISGMEVGGQLMTTTDVENYPGYADAVQGPWMMEQMHKQAENVGAQIVNTSVTEVDLQAHPFRIRTDDGVERTSDTVIVCTGAQARWLGLDSEETFKGFGVSACATCDGFFYRGKKVAVIGGGNTAVEEAIYLAGLADSVVLVHRRDSLRADKTLQARLFANTKIDVIWNAELDQVLGETTPVRSVIGARLRSTMDGGLNEIGVDGIFVAIGHSPGTSLFGDQLRLNDKNYIWTLPGRTETSLPGVFAAGDVTDDLYRQAVTAAGMGCMAALDAERFLSAAEK